MGSLVSAVNLAGYDATLAALRNAGVAEHKAVEFARRQFPDVGASHALAEQKAKTPKARQMNRTEAKRAQELETLKRAGEIKHWAYEAITLTLAPDCRYTPDFFVVENDRSVRFEETKMRWWEDARIKIRLAAQLYPMFAFSALIKAKAKDGGGWRTERFFPLPDTASYVSSCVISRNANEEPRKPWEPDA
jgi:hypothetical protein